MTGANAGLGRVTAEALAARKAEVHLVCRDAGRGTAARDAIAASTGNTAVHLHVVDVSDTAAVKSFAARWIESGKPVHALVNNAGVLPQERTLTREGYEVGMATALLQSYLLSGLLMPALALAGRQRSNTSGSPGRVINVSSGGGLTVRLDVDDLNCEKRKYDGMLQYAHAKRAQMMLTDHWATTAASAAAPVIINSMHPGWSITEGVKSSITDFYNKNKDSMRTAEQGADTIVWLAAAPIDALRRAAGDDHAQHPRDQTAGPSGMLWFDRSPASQHFTLAGTASTADEGKRLIANCEKMVGWRWEGSAEQAAVAARLDSKSTSQPTPPPVRADREL